MAATRFCKIKTPFLRRAFGLLTSAFPWRKTLPIAPAAQPVAQHTWPGCPARDNLQMKTTTPHGSACGGHAARLRGSPSNNALRAAVVQAQPAGRSFAIIPRARAGRKSFLCRGPADGVRRKKQRPVFSRQLNTRRMIFISCGAGIFQRPDFRENCSRSFPEEHSSHLPSCRGVSSCCPQ